MVETKILKHLFWFWWWFTIFLPFLPPKQVFTSKAPEATHFLKLPLDILYKLMYFITYKIAQVELCWMWSNSALAPFHSITSVFIPTWSGMTSGLLQHKNNYKLKFWKLADFSTWSCIEKILIHFAVDNNLSKSKLHRKCYTWHQFHDPLLGRIFHGISIVITVTSTWLVKSNWWRTRETWQVLWF